MICMTNLIFGIIPCFPKADSVLVCFVGKVCCLVRFSSVFMLSPKTPSDPESDPSSLRDSGQKIELVCLLYSPNGLSYNWPELWSLPLLISWGNITLTSPCHMKKKKSFVKYRTTGCQSLRSFGVSANGHICPVSQKRKVYYYFKNRPLIEK